MNLRSNSKAVYLHPSGGATLDGHRGLLLDGSLVFAQEVDDCALVDLPTEAAALHRLQQHVLYGLLLLLLHEPDAAEALRPGPMGPNAEFLRTDIA